MTQANQMTPTPVEVALRDGRAAERAGDATTEHVREAAAPALVQEHEQDHDGAGDHQHDGEEQLHSTEAYVRGSEIR
jgi:hypothetical protein